MCVFILSFSPLSFEDSFAYSFFFFPTYFLTCFLSFSPADLCYGCGGNAGGLCSCLYVCLFTDRLPLPLHCYCTWTSGSVPRARPSPDVRSLKALAKDELTNNACRLGHDDKRREGSQCGEAMTG